MRTSKPIATISYNTQEFLTYRLLELVDNHTISDWVFINHFAEKDEKKNHIHLWIKPNKLIDTMTLQDFFKEYDPHNPTKPLGCIDFRTSQADDWVLYGQHFEPYLISKGEEREYHYTKDDFVFNDEYAFDEMYNHAFKGSTWAKQYQVLEILRNTNNPVELINSGAIPLSMACSLSAYKNMQREDRTVQAAAENNAIYQRERRRKSASEDIQERFF